MEQKSVNLSNEQVRQLRERVERGEIDSLSEGVRNALNGESYDASNFRDKMDKYGVSSGILGMVLMALTLFAPMPYRFASLIPFAMSFICFGIGYVYDYNVSNNND